MVPLILGGIILEGEALAIVVAATTAAFAAISVSQNAPTTPSLAIQEKLGEIDKERKITPTKIPNTVVECPFDKKVKEIDQKITQLDKEYSERFTKKDKQIRELEKEESEIDKAIDEQRKIDSVFGERYDTNNWNENRKKDIEKEKEKLKNETAADLNKAREICKNKKLLQEQKVKIQNEKIKNQKFKEQQRAKEQENINKQREQKALEKTGQNDKDTKGDSGDKVGQFEIKRGPDGKIIDLKKTW